MQQFLNETCILFFSQLFFPFCFSYIFFFVLLEMFVYTPCCLVNKLKSLFSRQLLPFFFLYSRTLFPTSVYLWWVVCNYNTRVEYGSVFCSLMFIFFFVFASTLFFWFFAERRWMSTSNLSWFVLHFYECVRYFRQLLLVLVLTYVIHLCSCL